MVVDHPYYLKTSSLDLNQYTYDQLNIDLGQGALLDLVQRLVWVRGILIIDVIGILLELNGGKWSMHESIILGFSL